MKRYGYLIEEIIEPQNILESFNYVLRGNKRKRTRTGKYLLEHKEQILEKVRNDISSGKFKISGYHEKVINERGKERVIQCVPLYDRIVLHAIMTIVEKYLVRRFIPDSAASIKGRGTHYLFRRMVNDTLGNPAETKYVYKIDIKKYYQSIPQDVLMFVVKRCFKDKKLLGILEGCVKMLPSGISIGLRSSQVLGNLLLDYYLDHVLKDRLGVKYYRRYCDDIVIQAGSLHELTGITRIVRDCISWIGLEIKGNSQVYSIDHRGINFLGFILEGSGRIRIRKHIKHRFAKRWSRVKSITRKRQLISSFYGIAKHAHLKKLFKDITGIDMNKFSDFGFVFTASDGKKRFDIPSYPLGELQNKTVIIEDYETGITTKEGTDRYVVKFRDESGVGDGKFFTNSEEMKQALDKVSEIEGGFPFETTIKRKKFGDNKYKYVFS